MKTALILGVTGQTGAYLSGQLLTNGYKVVGSSRDWSESNSWRLKKLGILESIQGVSLSLHDHTSLAQLLDSVAPDEIYYLAGPSSDLRKRLSSTLRALIVSGTRAEPS
jgi:GDPmannose 4,6-dehydratase